VVCYPEGDWFSVKTTKDVDVLISNLERAWLNAMRESRRKSGTESEVRPRFQPELGVASKECSQ
jgi:hypothetical protein